MRRNTRSHGIQPALLSIIRKLPESRQRRVAMAAVLWQQVVGTILGRHTHVTDLDEKGLIHICVDDPIWTKPLKTTRKQIILSLNRTGFFKNPVTGFRCTIQEPVSAQPKPRPTDKSPDPEIIDRIKKEVTDPELQTRIIEAFRKYPDGYR